jgi:hypothetical protein
MVPILTFTEQLWRQLDAPLSRPSVSIGETTPGFEICDHFAGIPPCGTQNSSMPTVGIAAPQLLQPMRLPRFAQA